MENLVEFELECLGDLLIMVGAFSFGTSFGDETEAHIIGFENESYLGLGPGLGLGLGCLVSGVWCLVMGVWCLGVDW